jgi:hypothetical protein
VSTVLEEAEAASHPPDLVELGRDSMEPVRGFVVGASSELLLLHTLSDRVDLDGYSAVRVHDVTAVQREFTKKPFYLKALKLKGVIPTRPDGIDLSDVRTLMCSVEERYPLIVIHRERVLADEGEIGRIKLTSGDTYALRFISPTATWEDDDRTFRYADVTRVQFDGEYENTLALVAGSAG